MKKKVVSRTPFNPSYAPSEEQSAIFEMLQNSGDNIHCSAVAGSGKSTTLVWAMTFNKGFGALVCFNSDIASEIEPKCPPTITVKNFHKFGYGMVSRSVRGRLNVNGNQSLYHLKQYPRFDPQGLSGKEKGRAFANLYGMKDLISKLKVTLTDWKDLAKIMDVANFYGIEVDDWCYDYVAPIMDKMSAPSNFIDFDDMLWLPIVNDMGFETFPTLYVDECQDLSQMMLEFASRMKGDRIITVGDSRQAIYSFAGANSDSINRIKERFSSTEMPLNTCYRCSKTVVELAQTIVPHIRSYDKNEDGEVRELVELSDDLREGDMVLSRRNAKLINPYFKLIKEGIPAYIKGREIGAEIIKLVKKFEVSSIPELLDKVEENFINIRDKQMGRSRPNMDLIEIESDKKECVETIAMNSSSIEECIERIESMFSNEGKGVVLSSIHKAKGLEADRVSIVDYSNIRLNIDGMTDEQKLQEENLQYVAITRAKKRLDLIR